jgi:mRNA interferase MazF
MQTPNKKINEILRGEVYLVNLDPVVGNEIGKSRPALIIQNDVGNKFSPVTIIAPISSIKEITKPLPVFVKIEKGEGSLVEESFVDCGQIRTIDKEKRLIKKLGRLEHSRMNEVNNALMISLSLN